MALVATLRARAPHVIETPTTPRDFLEVADLESRPSRHQMESAIAASYHVSIRGIGSLTLWKTRLLNRSTFAFLIGFALLLVSIIPRW